MIKAPARIGSSHTNSPIRLRPRRATSRARLTSEYSIAATGPASPVAIEGVIAAIVHALVAVIEDGSIVASEVVGTRVGGIHIPRGQDDAGHGGQGHHAGSHGDSGHAGGFGHH